MRLAAGTRLGPYEIESMLGAGGMGEVYLARDTRLDRSVAIKVLAADRPRDDRAVTRLRREARAIAALHHPNVCAIYDVGEADGQEFLVMERLEGHTLQHRLLSGALDQETFLSHATALADALDAAHERGIMHRDLKPANVFITNRGELKVLDFGLARVAAPIDATTYGAEVTDPGVVVGTLAYMSPEQLRGDPLDPRSDLFSLGVVLYEMATGRRPFEGATPAMLSIAILSEAPVAPRTLRPDLPVAIEELVLKALEKSSRLRHQSAAEVRADLERYRAAGRRESVATDTGVRESSSPSVRHSSAAGTRWRGIPWAMGAVLAVSIAGVAALLLGRDKPAAIDPDTVAPAEVQRLTATGDAAHAAISSDGKFVAYVRERAGVWVRQVATDSDVQIVPFVPERRYIGATISPDNRFVDFVAEEMGGSDLWRVPLLGGTPQRLVRNVRSATGWAPDGRHMAFVRADNPDADSSVIVADADGRNERVLATRQPPALFLASFDPWTQNRPAWSPDGQTLLLVGTSSGQTEILMLDGATGAVRVTNPPGDRVVQETAWLSLERLLLVGGSTSIPLPWAADLTGSRWQPIVQDLAGLMFLTLDRDRAVAAATRSERQSGIWTGNAAGRTGGFAVREMPSGAGQPVLTTAGTLFYSVLTGDGLFAIHRLDSGAQQPTVIAREVAYPGAFALSPDERFAVFTSGRPPFGMHRVDSDGSAQVELVHENAFGPAVTRDAHVLYSPRGTSGLYAVPIEGGVPRLLTSRFVHNTPSISPDGRKLLFVAAPTAPNIVVCDLPDCTNAQELSLRSSIWTPDGLGVAYVNDADSGNLWQQPFDGGADRPITRLTDANVLEFSWSLDGQRLALARGKWSSDIVLIKGLRP